MKKARLIFFAVLIALLAVGGKGSIAQAQATPAASKLEFDVASVRQNKSEEEPDGSFPLGPGDVFIPGGGSLFFKNFPLINYIAFAYKVNPRPLLAMQRDLPEWVSTDRFDIQAKTVKQNLTKDDARLMMRALLAERFKLVMRLETQQVPAYALVLVKPEKTGPHLRPHPANLPCSSDPSVLPEGGAAIPTPDDLPPTCGGMLGMEPSAPDRMKMAGRNVAWSVFLLTVGARGNLGRPVLDQTGLTGKFDVAIEWVPDNPNADAPASSGGPSFLQAMSEQLGLKVVSTKGPETRLLIGKVDRLEEN